MMDASRAPQLLKFRLNCIDFYQTRPTGFDSVLRPLGNNAAQKHEATVPVIRVFGSTDTGQKVCAHIHGAFPYLYIEYHGDLDSSIVDSYIQTLATSIDHAFALSYRRNAFEEQKPSYVAHISLVKGIPFYGYHVGYRHFLKIYLRNPVHMTRFVDLLDQGAILGRHIQSYESHLQYLLQWMCDYNLYGCGYVICDKFVFRAPIPLFDDSIEVGNTWNEQSIASELVMDETEFPRQSYCDLEVDVWVEDIVNRREVRPRNIHQDFNERFFNSDGLKFVHSMANLWRDEAARLREQMASSDAKSSPFPPEALVTMSAEKRQGLGGWVHEEEFFKLAKATMKKERSKAAASPLNFDEFMGSVKQGSDSIQTAIESVADLFRLSSERSTLSGRGLTGTSSVIYRDGLDEPDDLPDSDAAGFQEQRIHRESSRDGWQAHGLAYPGNDLEHSPRKRLKLQHYALNQKELTGLTPSESADSSWSQSSKKNRLDNIDPNDGEDVSFPTYTPSQSSQKQITSSFPIIKFPNDPATQTSSYSKELETLSPRNTSTQDEAASPLQNPNPKFRPMGVDAIKKISTNMREKLRLCSDSRLFLFKTRPPDPMGTAEAMRAHAVPSVIAKGAFYSHERDVPDKPREYAGKEFRLQSISVPFLPEFDDTGRGAASLGESDPVLVDKAKETKKYRMIQQHCSLRNWEIATPPPSARSVQAWLSRRAKQAPDNTKQGRSFVKRLRTQPDSSQPRAPVAFGGKAHRAKAMFEENTQYLRMMSLEVHVNTRASFVPDPMEDAVTCVFWSIQRESTDRLSRFDSGVILLESEEAKEDQLQGLQSTQVDYVDNELDILNRAVDIVRDGDPDILVGYEVHNGSWGYLIERARLKYEYDLPSEFSRVRSQAKPRVGKAADRWGFEHTSSISITGRHMINVWRAIRGELNLLQYTLENVAFQVLKRRVPHYNYAKLTEWFQSGNVHLKAKVTNYYLLRAKLNLQILEAIDIVARTSEQARILGVDFFSVISRGSQFKVESLMFRIAKPENYILISPSRRQVGGQNALECLPLVMEPQSNFYPSPLLVLDFQSLYPSVMIAYNYCYSTCLGRVVDWRGQNKLGVTDYKREPGLLELLKDHINISPNGMIYVRPEIRKSLIGKMLTEILETRVMIKSGMKQDKDNQFLQRLLNNRQLALKLIANVTYGYTSASFSGRMPCSEIADSIVQTARETLERSIAMIHSREQWGAEVVYGDTDSLFVYLKGRSRDEAFKLGKEIAETITKANPRPVKLKFEKVYHPCVLLAKKRYVGFKYESPDQKVPEFDAKGIETVRRDGTPAEQKIEEKALKTLFRTHDLSKVKRYFQSECEKIMTGNVNIQDFLFAREVKLGMYSENGVPPAGVLIATKRMHVDARREPQYGERVPYIVMAGAPGARLIDRCVDPGVLLNDDQAQLDAEYYITKNLIPPLERIFNLVGANVRSWYDEMPKTRKLREISKVPSEAVGAINRGDLGQVEKTLENFLGENACLVCHGEGERGEDKKTHLVCGECRLDAPASMYSVVSEVHSAERRQQGIDEVCRSCSGAAFSDEIACDSRDCPVFYTRVKQRSRLEALKAKARLLEGVLVE